METLKPETTKLKLETETRKPENRNYKTKTRKQKYGQLKNRKLLQKL